MTILKPAEFDKLKISEPVYTDIVCQDLEERDTCGVHIAPSVLAEMTPQYPIDKLPQEPPAVQGVILFRYQTNREYFVFETHDIDQSRFNRVFWNTVYISNLPVETLDNSDNNPEDDSESAILDSEKGEEVERTALVSLQENKILFKEFDRDNYIIYDLETEQVSQKITTENVTIYDVPDSLVIQSIPDKYNNILASRTI